MEDFNHKIEILKELIDRYKDTDSIERHELYLYEEIKRKCFEISEGL